METVQFSDKAHLPTEEEITDVLGSLYSQYVSILESTFGYSKEWKYPGKKYGWVLKVEKKRKALFWLTPMAESFKIGFILRENERNEFLKLYNGRTMGEKISAAEKYPEGYGFSLTVKDKDACKEVRTFICELIEIREQK